MKTALLVMGLIVVGTVVIGQGQILTKDDYLKHIDTRADLTWAYSEYEICNPTAFKYFNGMNLAWKGDSKYVLSTKLQIKKTWAVPIILPIRGKQEICRKPLPNETKGIDICYNKTIIVGYTNNGTKTKSEWVDWNGTLDPQLSAVKANCQRVRVYSTLKPTLGDRKIEHIPSVFGHTYPEYSWWNNSFGSRRNLDINTTTPKANLQIELNITDGDAKSDFSDIRFVGSDDTTQLRACNWTQDDSVHVHVWLNLSESTNTTVYMYYNYSDAIADWDCNGTFEFYDDFEDYAVTSDLVGQGGWTGDAGGISIQSSNPYEGNRFAYLGDEGSDYKAVHAFSVTTMDVPVLGYKGYAVNSNNWKGTVAGSGQYTRWSFRTNREVKYYRSAGSPGWSSNVMNFVDNKYYSMNKTAISTSSMVVCFENNCYSDTPLGAALPAETGLWNINGGAGDIAGFDSVYVANSTWPTPIWALGPEENGEPAPTPESAMTIQHPTNTTYTQADIWFNVTVNSSVPSCVVNYGYGNNSLTNSSGNWNYINRSMKTDTYNATFWCDTLTDNVWFTVDICSYTNSSGDYDVNDTCTLTNNYYNIDGNLTIFEDGILNLSNATLNFTGSHQWMIFETGDMTDKLHIEGFSGIN
jgi:hypothetical protein